MRAAVYDAYGPADVVRIEDVVDPLPKPNEVRIRVRATTISSGDWRMRSATVPDSFALIKPFFFGRRPKQRVLGTELSGVIDAVGSEVERWKVGDAVFAFPGGGMGAHAELVCMPADRRIARKPESLSFEQAAALCFGGSTMLSFFDRAGGVQPGARVLVLGASGAVGAAAVQLASSAGAQVTAVCSEDAAEMAMNMGAARVLDYRKEDFRETEAGYDLVVDTVGSAPYATATRLLTPQGRALLIHGELGEVLRSMFTKRVIGGPASEDPAHLPRLAELAEAGQFTPPIDSVYPFEQIVEAHRRVERGHKRGSVVVTLAEA